MLLQKKFLENIWQVIGTEMSKRMIKKNKKFYLSKQIYFPFVLDARDTLVLNR